MATYNGAAYLRDQVDSILEQLGDRDELVVVDDASTDDTVAVLEQYADARISIHRSPVNTGYVRAFERALGLTTGDVVLLADQDDVWMPGRVELLRSALEHSGGVVASNLIVLGTDAPLRSPVTGRPWRLTASRGGAANIRRILIGDIPYYGCAMGMRREVLSAVLPFPRFLTESHDLWLAIVGNTLGEMVHLEQPTLWRRMHESNASAPKPRGMTAALRSRLMLVRAVSEARRRRGRS
jgi:glycosyltransferase involved in cell wall biosynthesis